MQMSSLWVVSVIVWIQAICLPGAVVCTSRCNVSDFEASGCIRNGYCTHDAMAWTSECNCTGVPCDFYLADIAETTGIEIFTLHVHKGAFGTIYSQSSTYFAPRHSYVVRLHAPSGENIKFEFSNIDMGGDDSECPGGSILVFDGHGYQDGQYLTKFPLTNTGFCSNKFHPRENMLSTTGYLTVAMTTSGRVSTFHGFNATYSVSGAVDGGWSAWYDWAPCSADCEAEGSQSRRRECTNPLPRQGGRPCEGNATQTQKCTSTLKCIPHVCEAGNYNGCTRHAVCGVKRTGDLTNTRRDAPLVCLCLNVLCKIYVEDLCRVSPGGRVLVRGAMGVVQSQLDVHYKTKQKCELTIQGPDDKWMMMQFTEFDMGGKHACTHGHLVVYDGISSKNYSRRYPSLDGSGYCSASQPPTSSDKFENTVIAENKYMTLLLDTSSNKEPVHTGFVAQFTAVEVGYIHRRFSDTEVKVIAFSAMGGVFLVTVVAMTIWCVLRQRKRRKHLRWLHIQYRKQSEEGMMWDSEADLYD